MVRPDWNISLGLLMLRQLLSCKNIMFSIILKWKIGGESGSLCFTRGLTIAVFKLCAKVLAGGTD